MAAIFQEAPPQLIVHPLPKNAKFFTYAFEDLFSITAWMPESNYHVSEMTRQSTDSFYEQHCDGCERNCYSYLDQFRDEDTGEIDWDEVGPHCDVHDEGYHGQECPLGNTLEPTEIDFDLCEIAFKITMRYRVESRGNNRNQAPYPRYEKIGDSAFLCNSDILVDDNTLLTTDTYLPSNVFGENEYPGLICWGRVERPQTLRAIESNFFSSAFNNDLVRIDRFKENSERVKSQANVPDLYTEDYSEKILYVNLGMDEPVDAVVMVDAEYHVHAFFTLLCAGFRPEEEAPHLILIPAKEVQLEKNGMTFYGYKTIPDVMGKEWFITQDNLLVGQI